MIWSVIRFDPAIHLYSLGMRFHWEPLADGGRVYTLNGQTVARDDYLVLPGDGSPGIPGVFSPVDFAGLGWERLGPGGDPLAQADRQLTLKGIER